MPKTRIQKEEVIKDLTDKFKKIKSVVFVDFKGLKMKEVEELRSECRKKRIDYLVAKKTLLKIALEKAGFQGVNPKELEGEIATVFDCEDEVAPARIMYNFSKKHEALKIVGGILESEFMVQEKVLSLAKLPSKDELLAKMVGSIKAPISGFVNVLGGNLRGLVGVLSAIKDNKQLNINN